MFWLSQTQDFHIIMQAKTLLVCITGPAHLLNFATAYSWLAENQQQAENIIVLHTQKDSIALQSLVNITKSLQSWLFKDSRFYFSRIPEGSRASVHKSLSTVISKMGKIDQLWLSRIGAASDNAILEILPNPPIILFSEGINFNQYKKNLWAISQRIKTIALESKCLFKGNEKIADVEVSHIPTRVVKSIYKIARGWLYANITFSVPTFDLPNPIAVVFAKSLYVYGDSRYIDELNHHVNLVTTLIDEGYNVLWVEHPRASAPFSSSTSFQKLFTFSNIKSLTLPQGIPFELIAQELEFSLSASLGSSAQLSLLEQSGVPAQITEDKHLKTIEQRPAIQFLKSILPVRNIDNEATKKYIPNTSGISDPHGAELALKKGIQENPKVLCLYVQLVKLLEDNRRLEEADILLSQALVHMSESAPFHLLRATFQSSLGKRDIARQEVIIAAELAPADPYLQHRMAYILQSNKDFELALTHAELSVDLDDETAGYQLLLASLYLDVANLVSAKKVLLRFLEISPSHARGHFLIAVTYQRLKVQKLAILHITRAIELEKNNTEYREKYKHILDSH